MATGENKNITGSLTLTDRYQLTVYDDTLTISNANIALRDPAGEIFLDAGNDTVTVTDSTITSNSATGGSLAFYLGSGDDAMTVSNSTFDTELYAGSGNDSVTVSGSADSRVTVSKKFSLGAGNDTLTLSTILAGAGALDFGDGNDTLVFDGGSLLTTGTISAINNLTVTSKAGTLGNNLALTDDIIAITLGGNLMGNNASRRITVNGGAATLNTANNVKTNIGLTLTHGTVLTQSDGGTLEFTGVNGYAIGATVATVDMHDVVAANCSSGAFYASDAILNIRDVGISNNTCGMDLTNTALTGSDVSFIDNTARAISAVSGNIRFDRVAFDNNEFTSAATASASVSQNARTTAVKVTIPQGSYYEYKAIASAKASVATAANTVGGALYKNGGSMTFSSAVFSGNKANTIAKSIAVAKASATIIANTYAPCTTATASANANASASGGAVYNNGESLTMTNVSFNKNLAVATAVATATSIGDHDPFLYIGRTSGRGTAGAKAFGGAIYHDSGILNLTSANFSGNNAVGNATASCYGFCSTGPTINASAAATAFGGAIYQNGGTITLNSGDMSGNFAFATTMVVDLGELAVGSTESVVYAVGGAIAAKNNSVINLNDIRFIGNYASGGNVVSAGSSISSSVNATAMGGAIYLENSTLNYSVTSGKSIANTGNAATSGGFIYLANTQAAFDIAGTLTVGDTTNKDSFAGDSASAITKLGSGTWTINSDISQYFGTWNVAAGKLKLERFARSISLDNWTIGIDAELHLSAGNDTINMGQDKKIGTINLGGGSDTINTGGYRLSGGKLLVSTLTLSGGGTVSSDIFVRSSGSGFDLKLSNITLNSNLTGGNAVDKIAITRSSQLGGTIDLGAGNNTVTASSGTQTTFCGTFTVGNGDDTLSFAGVTFEKDVSLGAGSNTLTTTGTAEFAGRLTALDGNDTLSFNRLQASKDISLGGGTNKLTVTGEASFAGFVGGSGNDTISLSDATFSGDVKLGAGTNTVSVSGTAAFVSGISGGSGNDTIMLQSTSTVNGEIALGGGRNYIYVSKSLTIDGGFKLNKSGETHLVVYNGAALAENALTLYDQAGDTLTSATLDWSTIPDLDKVRLVVSSDSEFKKFEFTVELYNQTKSFTLNLPDTYFIQFQAQDEDGWSSRLLPDTTAPERVTGVAFAGRVITWDPSHDNLGGNGLKQYTVQVSADSDFATILESAVVTDTEYTLQATDEGTYFFRVSAEDNSGNQSEWSETATVFVDVIAPSRPTGGKSTVDGYDATLSWNAASDTGSGVKEYEYRIASDSDFADIVAFGTTAGLSVSATNLGLSTYYWQVRAVDRAGNTGEWSLAKNFQTTDIIAPSAPANPDCGVNRSAVTVVWDGSSDDPLGSGLKGYQIQIAFDGAFADIVSAVDTSNTTSMIGGLDEGTYYMRICSVDNAGNRSPWTETLDFLIDDPDLIPPEAPTACADITAPTNQDVVVTAIFSDDSVQKQYSLNNSTWRAYTTGVVMSGNGPVYFRGIDDSGNISDVTSYEVANIDKVAPIKPAANADITALTNQNVIVTATFSDDSIQKQYSLDDESWQEYTTGVVMSANGTVYFRGIDAAGNISEVTSYKVSNIFGDIETVRGVATFSSATLVSSADVMSGKVLAGGGENEMRVYSGGVANSTTVNSRGSMYVSSGGVANSTTVVGNYWAYGGVMYVCLGGVANKTIVNAGAYAGGYLHVSSGGTANETTLNGADIYGGIMYVSSGGVANSTIINNGGSMYAYNGGEANYTTVNDWGHLYVYSGGVADSTTVNSGGIMYVSRGGKVTGKLTLAASAMVSAYEGSIIDFDLSNVASGAVARVNDLSLVQGAPAYTVTVSATQAAGIYSLADGAAGFNKTVTVNTDAGTTLGTVAVNGTLDAGGYTYQLVKDSALLTLIVDGVTPLPPPPPTVGVIRGDLNGDGRADIVMTITEAGHGAEGATGAWLIQENQTAAWGDLSQRNAGWEIFGMGVTTAGKATNDVYVKSTGNVVGAWTTDETGAVTGWETVGEFDATTQVLGLGDFNGDGQSDLLLRNTNGAVGCYFTSGDKTGWNYFQSLGDEWSICAVGDFNGDGRDDVVLKHDAGFAGSWLTQADGTMAWADLDTLPEGFAIVGAGDFNGDGTDDVLLQNGNYYGAWIVQDGNAKAWMGLGGLGSVTVEQIADFDADGIDDLRVRTTAGDLGAQLVKGEDTLIWKYYGSVGPEWSTALAAI